jgi:hypothetical protein
MTYTIGNCSLFSGMLLVCGRFPALFRTFLASDAGSSAIYSVSEKAVGEGGSVGMLCVLCPRYCEAGQHNSLQSGCFYQLDGFSTVLTPLYCI